MTQAAYCDLCGHNVYVSPDGSCPAGHDAGHLSDLYDVPETPQPSYVPATPATRAGVPKWVWALGGGLLFLFLLGFSGMAISTMRATREFSAEARCYANQADIERAVASYAQETGEVPSGLADLIPHLLAQEPVCPANGYYLVDPEVDWVSCSLHGYYGDQIVPVDECETNT